MEIYTPIESDVIKINANSIKTAKTVSGTTTLYANAITNIELNERISSKNISLNGESITSNGEIAATNFSATASKNINIGNKISSQTIDIEGASIDLNSDVAAKTNLSVIARSKISASSNARMNGTNIFLISSGLITIDKDAIISASRLLGAISENITVNGTLSSSYDLEVRGGKSLSIGDSGRILNIAKKGQSNISVIYGKSFSNDGIIATDGGLLLVSNSSYKNNRGSIYAAGISSNIANISFINFSKYKPD